ncbi:hypothetical protein Tco_1570922 [Tanacetum coccineum]
MAIDVMSWAFIKQVIIPFPGVVQCFVTFLLEVIDFFKLLSGLGWRTVPLDNGFFKEIPAGVFEREPIIQSLKVVFSKGYICYRMFDTTHIDEAVAFGAERRAHFDEQQRVIQAYIQMRNQEIIDDEERMIKRQEMRSSSGIIEPNKTEYFSRAGLSACKQFEQLRREAAAVKIEMDFKCFIVSKSYQTLGVSKVALQTG